MVHLECASFAFSPCTCSSSQASERGRNRRSSPSRRKVHELATWRRGLNSDTHANHFAAYFVSFLEHLMPHSLYAGRPLDASHEMLRELGQTGLAWWTCPRLGEGTWRLHQRKMSLTWLHGNHYLAFHYFETHYCRPSVTVDEVG